MTGPLQGLRVLEIAAIGPAPFAGMLLADLGADVIRIDRPGRIGSLRADGESHLVLDRARRSLSVDLKNPRGRALVSELAERVDVLLEGMRPGVMERLGLGPDALLARNPRLVYGRMTGWGQDGPSASRAGHDINYLAVSGALEPIAAPDAGPPVAPLNMLGDFGGGGMLLAVGVLSAVVHMQQTGEGQVVDAAILDGAALLTAMHHSLSYAGRWNASRGENLFDGGAPFYGVYRCADDRWLSIGAIEPKFYADLVAGLDLTAQLPNEQQYATSEWPRQRRLIAATVATRAQDEWVSVFARLDACVEPVLAPDEAPEAAQSAARGVYTRVDGLVHPQPAPRFSGTPTGLRPERASVGQNTREVLAGFGYSAGAIADLLHDGAVRQA